MRTIYKSTDPTGIAILGRLVSSPDAKLRRASATALARIHTSPTLPILANLLDSNDLMLQTYAVGGLAMFANNVPIGLHEPAVGGWPYRTDETIAHSAMDERLLKERPAYYIGFWKSWWAENRAKLGY